MHAAGLEQDRLDVAHRAEREQRDRDDAVDRAERDLGRHAEAEREQQDRIERDLGDRVERDQHRLAARRRTAGTARAQKPISEPSTTAIASATAKALQRLRRGAARTIRSAIELDGEVQRLPAASAARRRRRTSRAAARGRAGRRRARPRCAAAVGSPSLMLSPPAQQRLLPVRQHGVDHDRQQQDQQDQRIHRRVVEIGVGEADLVAHAAARHDELGADDADERVGHRELAPVRMYGAQRAA